MADETRRARLLTMEAIALCEASRQSIAAAHLQMALDLLTGSLRENRVAEEQRPWEDDLPAADGQPPSRGA